MQLHYRSADIELLLLDIMVWRDDEISLVEDDSDENLNMFTRWTRSQNSERFDRKGLISIFVLICGRKHAKQDPETEILPQNDITV